LVRSECNVVSLARTPPLRSQVDSTSGVGGAVLIVYQQNTPRSTGATFDDSPVSPSDDSDTDRIHTTSPLLEIVNCTFANNTATSERDRTGGGALGVMDASNIAISGSTFQGNAGRSLPSKRRPST